VKTTLAWLERGGKKEGGRDRMGGNRGRERERNRDASTGNYYR